MELAESVEVALTACERLYADIASSRVGDKGGAGHHPERAQDAATRAWIQRQVANLQSKLNAVHEDLAAGLTATSLGYADEEELLETLAFIQADLALLKSQLIAIDRALQLSH